MSSAGIRPSRISPRLVIAVVVMAATVVAGCSAGSPNDATTARRAAQAFLENTKDANTSALCASFSDALLARLAPPDGDCRQALAALTKLTGAGEASSLPEKRVDSVQVDGDQAIVVLTDRISGENELPLRFVRSGDRWLLDELGPGVRIAQACIDERTRVQAAVDKYLDAKGDFPPDAKALVPGYLPKLPDNHAVRPDGKVVATGVCA